MNNYFNQWKKNVKRLKWSMLVSVMFLLLLIVFILDMGLIISGTVTYMRMAQAQCLPEGTYWDIINDNNKLLYMPIWLLIGGIVGVIWNIIICFPKINYGFNFDIPWPNIEIPKRVQDVLVYIVLSLMIMIGIIGLGHGIYEYFTTDPCDLLKNQ